MLRPDLRRHGLLATVVPHSMNSVRYSPWGRDAWKASKLDSFPIRNDCGEHCAAFSLLTPQLPVLLFGGDKTSVSLALVFEANAEVWEHVQCLAVTDSNTANRACCACWEREYCPAQGLDQYDSGYCAEAKAKDDATYKQLAAGCGVTTTSIKGVGTGWGELCSDWDIAHGNCDSCRAPQWCDDRYPAFGTHASTPDEWLGHFYGYGRWMGTRQCKYRPSQRDLFVSVTRAYHTRRQQNSDNFDGEPTVENEVNVFIEPGGETNAAFMSSLIGLVFLRTTRASDNDVQLIRELHSNLKSIGGKQHLYALSNEQGGTRVVEHWSAEADVDLRSEPYSLEVLEL